MSRGPRKNLDSLKWKLQDYYKKNTAQTLYWWKVAARTGRTIETNHKDWDYAQVSREIARQLKQLGYPTKDGTGGRINSDHARTMYNKGVLLLRLEVHENMTLILTRSSKHAYTKQLVPNELLQEGSKEVLPEPRDPEKSRISHYEDAIQWAKRIQELPEQTQKAVAQIIGAMA